MGRVTAPDRPLVVLAVIALAEGLGLLAYAVFDIVEAIRVGKLSEKSGTVSTVECAATKQT